MTTGDDTTLVYNWDNKLRHGQCGSRSIDLKYDPMGNRVWKQSSVYGTRKYIIDVSGGLPTILMEINPGNGDIMKTYIYANGQILAQHNGSVAQDNKYFYLHDRIGSIRQMIDTTGSVVKYYTYEPFGEILESQEQSSNLKNSFLFTGQFFDAEINEYYLRARQYDPHIARFTARDPVFGKFQEPFTLHKYLYCENDPVNHIDPKGRFAWDLANSILTGAALYAHGIDLATYAVSSENWNFFDLAQVTFQFMPIGMSIASLTPIRDWRYVAGGYGSSSALELAFRRTGMSYPEGFAMDPAAFILYSGAMWTAEIILGVSSSDRADFARWHGSWW